MGKIINTEAFVWEEQGKMPYFKKMELRADENSLIVHVKAAMFGKALHRAITIGHPKIRPPRVLGTLLSGEAANDMEGVKKGERIVINPHAVNSSNQKLVVAPGAMSKMAVIRNAIKEGVYVIPHNVKYEEAVYTELIACALEAIDQVKDADELVIVGCGLMALIQIQLAKNLGIDRVTCIYNRKNRDELIRKYGAEPVKYDYGSKSLIQAFFPCIQGKKRAIIDSAGTIDSARILFELANDNTELVLFAGYPAGSEVLLDLNKIHYGNIHIRGSYHFQDKFFRIALELLSNHIIEIEPLITGRYDWYNIDELLGQFNSLDNISNVVILDD